MAIVNQPQSDSSQREMPWLSAARVPAMAPHELIVKCRNRLDAIRLCAQLSNLSHETICENLGIDKGHWSRIMQGRANFPDSKSVEFMYLCGNFAPMQYEAWKTGFELHRSERDKRIAELESELSALKLSQGPSTLFKVA